jgi:hypothetical protein
MKAVRFDPVPTSAGRDLTVNTDEEEADEDNMEEVDPSNIVSGERATRAKVDYAKAAQEADDLEDDEEDDEDFVAPEDEDEDAMQE